MTQPNPSPSSFMQQSEQKSSRTGSPRGKNPSGGMFRLPCKGYLKRTCTNSVKSGTLQNACSTRPRVAVGLGKSGLMHTVRLMNSPAKGLKRMVTKVQWLCWKFHDNLGCVCQDMEPPKSSSILRKSSDMRKPIRRVKFTKAVARHAYIRDQNHSLGLICPGVPHQRSHNAQNLRIGLRRRQSGKSDGPAKQRGSWPKLSSKLKEKNKAAFFSPSEK